MLFHSRLAGAIGIIELEGAFTGLTTVTLMTTFAVTVFLNRVCLFTKRTPYINFSHHIPASKAEILHHNQHIEYLTLFYLIVAYAIALPLMALFTDLVITGSIIDIWRGSYSFAELLSFRKILFLKFAGLGAVLGFFYWLFFYRKYRHHDPLDKYFK